MRVQLAVALVVACAGLAACKPPRIDRAYAECEREAGSDPGASNETYRQLDMITCMEAWGYSWKLTDACSQRYLKPTKDAGCYERDSSRSVKVDPP